MCEWERRRCNSNVVISSIVELLLGLRISIVNFIWLLSNDG